jgi:hypothetical protein
VSLGAQGVHRIDAGKQPGPLRQHDAFADEARQTVERAKGPKSRVRFSV